MKKNKIVIHLMGRDYTLLSDQSAKRIQSVAQYVDRKMREVSVTTRAGDAVVPTLTAMILGDELLRAQEENVRLKRELAALKPEQKI